MIMYDIIVDGKIKQICGNYDTALKFKEKYKQAGFKSVEIKERQINI